MGDPRSLVLSDYSGPGDGPYICAWCGKYLGHDHGIKHISHGICMECAKREFEASKVVIPSCLPAHF
jgi:hypothetical protein